MLFRWIALILVVRHLQCLHQLVAGIARHDDLVYEATLGSAVRVGELVFILLDNLLLLFGRGLTVEDVHRTLGTHHGDFRLRISQVHVGTRRFAGHHDVGAAVCLAGNQRYLGHGGLGIGIDNLGAVADDAVVLLHLRRLSAGC